MSCPRVARWLALALLVALAPARAEGQASGEAQPTPTPTDDAVDAVDVSPDEESDEEQSGEVIVIDSRSEKPLGEAVGAVEVVDRASIRQRGARTLGDALRGHIGLEVVPALRGTSVRVQGLDSSYVLILIDGLPAIGRIDSALDVDRLPVDDVERIEVIKGASSALYGSDALGGVINVVTRDADRPFSAEATAIYGSRDRIDASATGAVRREVGPWRVSSRVALGMRRADGYDLDPSTTQTEGPRERSYDGAVRIGATRGLWRVTAAGDYLRQDLLSIDGGPTGLSFDRRTLSENGSGSAGVSFRPRSDTTLSATLRHAVFRDQFLLDPSTHDQPFRYEPTDERLTSAALVASSLVHPAHLVTGGIDGSAEGLSSERLAEDGSRERLGVYAQDEWMVLDRPQLILVPGGRLDLDSQFGVHATPKLAARWDATDRVIARASAGFGYRAPDFRQLLLRFENQGAGYRVEGNTDLGPETSMNGTVSVDVEPVSHLSLAAQAYWNEVDDLIGFELVPPEMGDPLSTYRYVNVASARTRGVELQARVRFGRTLSGSVSYTLADTLDRDSGHELTDRARHRGTFELRARPIDRVTLAAHGELVGKRSFFVNLDADPDDEVVRADRYAWIGARAEVDVTDNLSLFVGGDNLAGAGDTEFLPITPRAFYAGLRGHYDAPVEPDRAVTP